MAHSTLIGGTEYTIKGGKTLIGGTEYSIKDGKTLVGGTAYNISFGESRIVQLMTNATKYGAAGRNNSSSSLISVSYFTEGTYYAFVFCNGDIGIHKIVAGQLGGLTLTTLYQSNAPYCSLYKGNQTISLSNDGVNQTTVYGGTIVVVTFTGFTEEETDTILSRVRKQSGAGRNASSTSTVGLATSADSTVLTAWNQQMALQFPVGTVIFGTYSTNPSLSRYTSGTLYISTNGTSNTSVCGASIITL